jgi:predicted RNase H-like nuclease (RuvC/YqgF family)
MTTDTPRTDAARERYYDGKTSDWVHYTICRMIEQELAASQAESESRRQSLAFTLSEIKKAEAEVERLRTENFCLQELIQEFYEWSRRDYPTEAEVREIMDRYYNLLNK